MDINGIRFWCYNAGHVLGAAMFMIEIAGVKVGQHCYKMYRLIPSYYAYETYHTNTSNWNVVNMCNLYLFYFG